MEITGNSLCQTSQCVSVLIFFNKQERKEKSQKRRKNQGIQQAYQPFKSDDNSYYLLAAGDRIEAPYKIPSSWQWCKMSQLFHIIIGVSPNGESISDNRTGMEFHQGKLCFTSMYLDRGKLYTSHPLKIAPAGSVLLSVRAPVGEINITDRDICIGRGLAAIVPKGQMDTLFVFYWMEAFKEAFVSKATGSTFPCLSVKEIKEQLIPLPPLAEQKRITNRLEQFYYHLESIKNSL